jgi:formylglycine-generating enzyme required for sulfatase activity
MRIHTIFPDEFPEPWASDWGEDDHGIFMGFTYKGVRQDFRWIEPGTFMMGSPKNEPGRESLGADESQHEVTLTQGFWLADTTVTQALWEAVMGNNPSRFKGANRPVETVSWEEAQAFIRRMNEMKPELRLCLPTEAQWEYACRAGTTTTFSFGEQISPEIVNYDGNYPYHHGSKGEYREQTVEVASLPPNDWGLYEMHGNVWEWCRDRYGDYPAQPVVDPTGVESGADRVLRGGSWINYGRGCRSAYRNHDVPAFRSGHCGFRLARGL